ncbi:MAG TPA: hypothetical protein VGM78_09765, partial [Ilumatobacteraceae bacterium]
ATATVVRLVVDFERGSLGVVITMTTDGALTGIQLTAPEAAAPLAPWQPPEYADPTLFVEQDVRVGDGALAVPGTLSIPNGMGPWPAVVLLAGSGPQDRDETLGRNKPLKDVAWGLASRSIAVLRFDKVTFAHQDALRDRADFTLTDEYLPDAAGAVRLVLDHEQIDSSCIILAGHSLGGTVIPRIITALADVAAAVILAGGTVPMHRASLRQVRYLASSNPDQARAAAAMIDAPGRPRQRHDSGLRR